MERFALSAPENILSRALEEQGHQVDRYASSNLPDGSVDLYHANFFSEAAIYLALRRAHPLVYSPHDGFDLCRFPVHRGMLEKPLKALILANADVVVALSEIEANHLTQVFNLDPAKISVVPNGVDVAYYPKGTVPAYSGPSTPIMLLAVGQLEDFKGHIYLLKALTIILPRFPNVHLVIVTHNARLLTEYQRFCEENRLDDHVEFVDSKATDELASYYSKCDIFVQPSLVDNFPVTILEAMACGRPVVASNVGSVSEQLSDGSGILVTPGDFEDLARAIMLLIKDPQLRSRLGNQARNKIESLYTYQLMCEKHLAAYQKAIRSFSLSDGWRISMPRVLAHILLTLYRRRNYIGRYLRRSQPA